MGSIVEVGLANAAVVAVLALVVGGLGSVCRRPALVHSLWVIVLIKLLTPPLLSVPLPHLSWGEEQVKTLEIVLVKPTDLDDLIDEANDMMTIEPALTPEPGWSWRSLLLAGWLTGSLGWLAVTLTRVGKFRRV